MKDKTKSFLMVLATHILGVAAFFAIWLPVRKSSRVTASAAGEGLPGNYLYNYVLYYIPSNSTTLQFDTSLDSYLINALGEYTISDDFYYMPFSAMVSKPDVDLPIPVLGIYAEPGAVSMFRLCFVTPCDERFIPIENGMYVTYDDFETRSPDRIAFVSRFLNVNYYIFSSTQHSGTDVDAAYSDGYSSGYNLGYNKGHDEGYQEGWDAVDAEGYYNTGYNNGYSDGFQNGREEGYMSSDGYQHGYEVGKSEAEGEYYDQGYGVGYNEGHEQGYNSGNADGLKSGYVEGEKVGYDKGQEDGYQTGYNDGMQALEAYDEGYDKGYTEGYSNGLNK